MMFGARAVALAVFLAAVSPPPARGQCSNGVFSLTPVNLPANVVRLSRVMSVVANASQGFKIIFDNLRLSPPTPLYGHYVIFGTLFSSRLAHPDGVCTIAGVGTWTDAQAMISPNIQDYPNVNAGSTGAGLVGSKSAAPILLPNYQGTVDNRPGFWLRGSNMQYNLNFTSVVVDVHRRDIVTDTTGWQCGTSMPAGDYRQWDMRTTVLDACDGQVADGTTQLIAPNQYAQYLGPFGFSSEFFTSSPGLYKVYMRDMKVQLEGGSTWQDLCTWRVDDVYGCGFEEYGVKLSKDAFGRDVIEMSNDGPATGGPGGFFAPGTVFTIPNCS